MPLIEWDEKYSVGIQQIDEQHKQLIDLINALHDARCVDNGRESLATILHGLVSFAARHFTMEEDLLVQYEYPEFESHRREHDRFVQKVSDFHEDLNDGASALSDDVMYFLRDWLIHHILGTDMKYSSFLKEKGLS